MCFVHRIYFLIQNYFQRPDLVYLVTVYLFYFFPSRVFFIYLCASDLAVIVGQDHKKCVILIIPYFALKNKSLFLEIRLWQRRWVLNKKVIIQFVELITYATKFLVQAIGIKGRSPSVFSYGIFAVYFVKRPGNINYHQLTKYLKDKKLISDLQ